jgi:hypothetical protein
MDDLNLKALQFRAGVIRTAATDPVIKKLDDYFAAAGHIAYITSVLRTPEAQLLIIQNYAQEKAVIASNFVLTFDQTGVLENVTSPLWQIVWSQLLSKGILVNPPRAAMVLTDYMKDGVNKKGEIIQPSAHFLGIAFDIGGGENGIADELAIVQKAADTVGINYVRVERENNCVHCQV